jgi:hypothetical protein
MPCRFLPLQLAQQPNATRHFVPAEPFKRADEEPQFGRRDGKVHLVSCHGSAIAWYCTPEAHGYVFGDPAGKVALRAFRALARH